VRVLSVCCLLLISATARAEDPADRALWDKIDKATSSVEQVSYTLVKQERLTPTRELEPAEIFFVKYRKPYDIYMDVIGGPHKGRHILYRKGWDALKVHVFSRAFQWMVPKIWLMGDHALDGNHHPMTEAALDHTVATIKENYLRNERLRKEDPNHPAIQIEPVKDAVENGIPVYYFRSTSPELYNDYTVTAFDHNIFDLGNKVHNQGYTILYYNADKIRKWDDLHVGQKLRIPVYYSKVSEFWVDKRTLLITHIRITDFFGKVYEEYKHENMLVGSAAGLSDRDFDPANPDYGGF
jgi:hypothetical protein